MNTTKKLYGIAFVFVFLLSTFPLVAQDAQAVEVSEGTNNSIEFTDASYVKLPDGQGVFGDGGTVYFKITNPTGTTLTNRLDRGPTVHLTATAGTSTVAQHDGSIKIETMETGPATGIFVGSFTAQKGSAVAADQPTDENPIFGRVFGDATVRVSGSAAVTTIKAQIGTSGPSDTVAWRESSAATLTVTPTPQAGSNLWVLGHQASAHINVTDRDRNTDTANANKINVRVFSDSDPAGVTLELTETAASSTFFHGTVQFEASNQANNQRVFAKHNDRVHIVYSDPHGADGEAIDETAVLEFKLASDGVAAWGESVYIASAVATTAKVTASIILLDADLGLESGGADSIAVPVHPASNPSHVLWVCLTEVGGLTGTFVGDIELTTGSGDPPESAPPSSCTPGAAPKKLPVSHGESAVVTYRDQRTGQGFEGVPVQQSTIFRIGELPDVTILGDKVFAGTAATATVRVSDFDANQNTNGVESIAVRIKSTSDPSSLLVTLTETGPSTGVFQGSFGFTTGSTGSGKIEVADRDQIVAEYTDTTTSSGLPQVAKSAFIVWRAPTTASAFLDAPEYVYKSDSATEFGSSAQLYVTDQDQNNPFGVDSITISFAAPSTGSKVTVEADEIGRDSGIFHYEVPFGVATQEIPRLDPGGNGLEVRVEYQDPTNAQGNPETVTSAPSIWREGPTVELRRFEVVNPAESAGEWQTVLYLDPNDLTTRDIKVVAYTDDASNPGPLRVTSERCSANPNASPTPNNPAADVPLENEGASNRWVGILRVTTNGCEITSDPPTLGVNVGNTIHISGGSTANDVAVRQAAASISVQDPVTGETLGASYGERASVQAVLTGGLGNENDLGRDLVTLQVATPANHEAGTDVLSILALETGSDTGIFQTTYSFASALDTAGLRAEVSVPPASAKDANQDGQLLAAAVEARAVFTSVDSDDLGIEARGSNAWYPAGDAVLEEFPGIPQTIAVVDDLSSGFVPRETKTAATGGQQRFTLDAGPAVRNSVIAFATTTEPNTGNPVAGEQTYTVLAAGEGSKEPISDRNFDGSVNCADVTISGGGTTRCLEVIASDDGRFTQVRYSQACATDCSAQITYMYRGVPGGTGSPNNDIFHYRFRPTTSGSPAEEVEFGASIPQGRTVVVGYRQLAIGGQARSVNGGETDSVSFRFDDTFTSTTQVRYLGTVLVETASQGTNNGRVFVREGTTSGSDTLHVAFRETRAADGQSGSLSLDHFRSDRATLRWVPTTTGTIQFFDLPFSTTVQSPFVGPLLGIQVTDAERDQTANPDSVILCRVDPPASGCLEADKIHLRETASHSGLFRAVIPISATATLTFYYEDQFTASGTEQTISRAIAVGPTAPAEVEVAAIPVGSTCADASFGADATVKGSQGSLCVRVSDPDANRNNGAADTISVVVRSKTDPTGETITLTETATSSLPATRSGVFLSPPIGFETGSAIANNDRVFVADLFGVGEELRVWYVDPLGPNGLPMTVVPMDGATPGVVMWKRTFNGAVRFDSSRYIGSWDGTGSQPKATLPTGVIVIADADLGTQDPTFLDTTTLEVVGAGEPLHLTAFETGVNTGTFVGVFTFETTDTSHKPDDPAAPETVIGKLQVDGNENVETLVQFGYVDLEDSTGDRTKAGDTPPIRNALARWVEQDHGVVILDASAYDDLEDSPEITLWDANRDANTNLREKPSVTVRSQSDPAGISIELEETGLSTGVFKGSFDLTAGESSGTNEEIQVATSDTIAIRYQDNAPHSQPREATAIIAIGDKTAPTTSLVTDPAEADGENGWFQTAPEISFSGNEQGATTFYRLTEDASPIEFVAPFSLGQGQHTVFFWSVDAVGNVEAEKEVAVNVDLEDPTQTVSGLVGAPAPAGDVLLTWEPVAVTNDPLEFGAYVVFRDGVEVGNATEPTFTDTDIGDENPHVYEARVADASGRLGPEGGQVSVTPDATPPQISSATVSPTTFDTRAIPEDGLAVSVSASDLNLATVTVALVTPAGETIAETELSGTASFTGTLDVSTVEQPCSCVLRFTANDTAGNEATIDLNYTVTGPDTQLPTFSFSGIGANDEAILGATITVQVTDNVGLATVSYSVDGGAVVDVPVVPEGSPTVSFTVATTTLGLGSHSINVTATDTATDEEGNPTPNEATTTRLFTVIEPPTPPPPGLANRFLPTTVTKLDDGSVRVSWTLPDELSDVTIAGFQVWRSSSPFVEVYNTTDPDRRSYRDATAEDGTTYRYVTTFWLPGESPVAALSDVLGYPGSDDAVAASDPVTAGGAGGIPGWFWWVLGVLAVAALAVLIVVAVVNRSRQETVQERRESPDRTAEQPTEASQEEPEVVAEAEGAAAGETHRLKCPQCSHSFQVSGTKPIVTNCPNCGRRGILR